MIDGYNYLAFISYKREDERFAKWLQRKLESYHIPLSEKRDKPYLPNHLRPIFRDTTDLSGGKLESVIENALKESKYLIVICSIKAAQSPWVCKEIETFIEMGKIDNIIPIIIEGIPHSVDPNMECLPYNLRSLTGKDEILCIDIDEMGKDAAVIKIVANMLGLKFDSIWNRAEKARRQRQKIITYISIAIIICLLLLITGLIRQNLKIEQQNITLNESTLNLKKIQALAVAEKAKQLIDKGDYRTAAAIAIEVSPKNGYPYVPNVECVLREALDSINHATIQFKHTNTSNFYYDNRILFSPSNQKIILPYSFRSYPIRKVQQIAINYANGATMTFNDWSVLCFLSDSICVLTSKDSTHVCNINTKKQLKSFLGGNSKISPNKQLFTFIKNDSLYFSHLNQNRNLSCLRIDQNYEIGKFNSSGNLLTLIPKYNSNLHNILVVDNQTYNIDTINLKYRIYCHFWINDSTLILHENLGIQYLDNKTNHCLKYNTNSKITTKLQLHKSHFARIIEPIPQKDYLAVVNQHVHTHTFNSVDMYDLDGNYMRTDIFGDYDITCLKSTNNLMAIGNDVGEVFIYNLTKEQITNIYKYAQDDIVDLIFSPNNEFLAITGANEADGDIILRLKETKHKIYAGENAIYSNDDSLFLRVDADDKKVHIHIDNIITKEHKRYVGNLHDNVSYIASLAISPNKKYAATISILTKEKQGQIHIWDLQTDKIIMDTTIVECPSTCLFTPDNTHLSVTLWSKNILFINLNTLESQNFDIKWNLENKCPFMYGNNLMTVEFCEQDVAYTQVVLDPTNNQVYSSHGIRGFIPAHLRDKYVLSPILINNEEFVEIYDIKSKGVIYRIKAEDLSLSNNGDKICAYIGYKKIRIYDFPNYEAILNSASTLINERHLTPFERKSYHLDARI